ncbi:DUF397 domain-containing protein [Streptomyces cylindrosporus]|uniref:DUF397 domain-containing protein n=1 Tax=Streptomyces cylindrosporus TaxID=2927583 RepID=A0ABS9XYP0_9ACTN|nr:DUF397 domain-containing protein [Streptomyces cylindrosporus]MCI3270039.1 DUF397 domain-containing protein [Streptomyces cylindrosporus]
MENQATQWRKSSYSGDQGGDCLEWRKSRHSSDQGGECLEFAEAPTTVSIRDSKNPAGPVLSFRPDAFRQFVSWSGATAAG